jgi:phage baseplate assembly protein gpV
MSALYDLAGVLANRQGGTRIDIGTVYAVDTVNHTVSVRIGEPGDDDAELLEDLPRMKSYSGPAIGDIVVILSDSDDQVVIGELA